MIEEIKRILKEGPKTSSEIIDIIQHHNHNIKRETIRKRLSRAHKNKEILVKTDLPLLHNQFVYYLPDQERSIKNIEEDLISQLGNSPTKRILSSLNSEFYDGIIDVKTIQKIAGLPISEIKGIKRSSFNKIMKNLVKSQLVRIISINNLDFIIKLSLDEKNKLANKKAHFIIKCLKNEKEIRSAFLKWMEKNNFIAWAKSIDSPSIKELAIYNDLPWDAFGPSYIEPVKNLGGDPRPVLFETVTYRNLEAFDVEGFISRINILKFRISRTDYRPMGIILCRGFTKEAQSLAKKKGLILFTLENFIGKSYSRFFAILQNFIKESEEIDSSQLTNSAYYYIATQQNLDRQLFSSLLGNMKGLLLEFIIGYIFRIRHYQTFLRYGHRIGFDIIAENKYQKEKWLIECKAYSEKAHSNLYEEGRKFLTKVNNYVNKNGKELKKDFQKINACFISIHNPPDVSNLIVEGKVADFDLDRNIIRAKGVGYNSWGSEKILWFTPDVERPKIREVLNILIQSEKLD